MHQAASPLLKDSPAEEFRRTRIVVASRAFPRLPAFPVRRMAMTAKPLNRGFVPKRDNSAALRDILKDTWQTT
jgi:hypothetical protein